MRKFRGKFRIAQDRCSVTHIDIVLQLDPRLAAFIGRQHRKLNGVGQAEDANGNRENIFAFPPIEALHDHFIAPDVLTPQPLRVRKNLQPPPFHDFSIRLEAQGLIGWKIHRDLVEPPLRMWHDRFSLLVKERREEKELRTFDPEAAAPLADAALAQNDDLLPAPQRIRHNRPFFERRSHIPSLPQKQLS